MGCGMVLRTVHIALAWIDYVDAAAWMGHDKMTHIKYYASWTNETKKMQSASEFNAAVAAI